MKLTLTTFQRYVLLELLKVFAIALTSLTILMLVVGVMRQALDEGIGLKHIVLLVPYILPDALRFTIPATALFAAACVYGRMSGSNEIVALKSLGVSPLAILWPTYVAAFVLSLLTVCLNDVAVSWGRQGARRVVLGALEDVIVGKLEQYKQYTVKDFSVVVKDVEDRRLIEPIFTYQKRNQRWTLRADYARLESNGQVLLLRCANPSGDEDGETEFSLPDKEQEFVREFELEDFRKDDTERWSPSYKSLAEIELHLEDHPRKMEQIHREHAVKAALQLVAADYDALAGGEWVNEMYQLEQQRFLHNRMRTEPPRRWANGFSCLSFVIVGSTMAIWRRNSNALSSFFVCFLPILIVYYPLLMLGVGQAKNGTLPPSMVWIGNGVLALCGLWLLRRVMRY